ncbi:MAG: hypothetical protein U0872_09730 [Planctomycetaceae bacterium]
MQSSSTAVANQHPLGAADSSSGSDSLALFLALPAVAMSLGWGLRGTIGGGQIGAMIPGAVVMLCLAHLLNWSRSLGIVAAIGTVGIALGGQETYGQTIGFLRDRQTVLWGLTGLTVKGGMWGLSGGVLVGLAFMHGKYRPREILLGLMLMIAATMLGIQYLDAPQLIYFSNPLDKPRPEAWAGITLGALALWAYLRTLNRESVTTAFTFGGLLAGAAGFGGGSLFLAYGATLSPEFRSWPWWKLMEFSFGALFGLGLGAVAYWKREILRDTEAHLPFIATLRDPLDALPAFPMAILGWTLAVIGIWLNFHIPYRASFSLLGPALILVALPSNRVAWHIALTMTITGFLRDFLQRALNEKWLEPIDDTWWIVWTMSFPVAFLVAFAESHRRLTAAGAVVGLVWLATPFALIKVGFPLENLMHNPLVFLIFVGELLATTALLRMVRPLRTAAE